MAGTKQSAVKLNPRELEITRRVAKGESNQAIAGALRVSRWTVATHLRRISAKLGVTSRAAMVAEMARQKGAQK
jgi:DNA-binding CsgD family transcriptional regulator